MGRCKSIDHFQSDPMSYLKAAIEIPSECIEKVCVPNIMLDSYVLFCVVIVVVVPVPY